MALYLTAAGVGMMTVADHDVVEPGNLNRQVLYGEADIGRLKIEVAVGKLQGMNSGLRLTKVSCLIDEDNAWRLIGGASVVVDATDNLPVRYALNKAALDKGIPLVHGAVRGFEGKLATVMKGRTPCLRCIYPEAPPPAPVPVLGVTPGVSAVCRPPR